MPGYSSKTRLLKIIGLSFGRKQSRMRFVCFFVLVLHTCNIAKGRLSASVCVYCFLFLSFVHLNFFTGRSYQYGCAKPIFQ